MPPPDDDLGLRPGLGERVAVLRERLRVDDGAHEVAEVGDVAHRKLAHLGDEPVPESGPQAARDEEARRGGALLSLVLERPADDRRRERVRIRARMGEDEVLAACLADDPRIVAIPLQAAGDRPPHAVEHRCRAREVDACEIRARERGVPDGGAGAEDEVDHAGREACLLEELHQEVRGERRGGCGLPEDRVPHERGARREVAGDGREVEGRDCEDEALERAVVELVARSVRRERLLGVDALREGDVEAPEVDQLAGRVDLRLVRGLRLAEHRRGVEPRAPRACEELGRAEEDARSLLPGGVRPLGVRRVRCRDRALDLGGATACGACELVRVRVRLDHGEGVSRLDALPTDDRGDVDVPAAELLQRGAYVGPLGASRGICPIGLVDGIGCAEHRGRGF